MHSCGGQDQVWMCRPSQASCPADKAPLAPEMEFKEGHAGCGCPYCQRRIGFCAGDDLQSGLQAFFRMKDVIEEERMKQTQA